MRTSGSRDAPNSPAGDVLLLKALQLLLFCASLSIAPARNSTKSPFSGLKPALGSTDVQCFLRLFGLPCVEVHEVSSYSSLCSQGKHLSIKQASSSEQPSEQIWWCPNFSLLLQSPVLVLHRSPPLLHLLSFRQLSFS